LIDCVHLLLLLQDIVLFEALISDLFRDTQLPAGDDRQLRQAITGACWAAVLQPEPAFLSKALQLHDTLGVRFGVMLVGPAGGLEGAAVGGAGYPCEPGVPQQKNPYRAVPSPVPGCRMGSSFV
jgi:hypothetical protein